MKHIVIDLEMNKISRKNPVRSRCSQETIEIGAVMLDDNLQEASSFRTYVKPEFNKNICANITQLTGITDDMVCNAPKFCEAFKMFTSWCIGTGDEIKLYSWSNSDFLQIRKEIGLKNYQPSEEEKMITEHEWHDFQHEFDNHLGFDRQLSLATALDMAGIDFSGREHNALDDARNTAELLQIFKDEKLFNATLKRIRDAMKPSNCSVSLGELIDFSAFL